MFRSRRARPVWGVAFSRVSDQSTIRRPLTISLFPADLQATLGIFTGNARNGAIDAELRLRALLARAHGDAVAYADLRDRYRDMAKSLGFEGHIAWAEAMP